MTDKNRPAVGADGPEGVVESRGARQRPTSKSPKQEQDRPSESEWDRMWKLPFVYPREEGER
jgi:hypothetical protein